MLSVFHPVRRESSVAIALIAGCVCSVPGSVLAGDVGGFAAFTPLSASELFEKRMRFSSGEPIVSVGIMTGQRGVALEGGGPLRLMFEERRLPKTVYAPEKTRFSFSVKRGRAAEVRTWVVVDTLPYLDVKGAAAARAKWAKEKLAAHVFDVGTVVGVSGNVLDTREKKVAVGGFLRRAQAEALAAKLFSERGLRTTLFEELVKKPSGTILVRDAQRRVIHRATNSVFIGTLDDEAITIFDVEHSKGYASHGRQTRRYWGGVYVVIDRDGKLAVVNSVGAERLLGGLVPAEIFATAPAGALRAQAVTARGEIFSKLAHRHFAEPYHLCSAQHCQVYAGAGREQPATNAAVDATRGLLAVRPRRDDKAPLELVDSVYASTCGGFSEANEVVWDQTASPSLRPRLDGPANDPALKPFANGLNASNMANWVRSYPPTYCARSSFAKASKVRWKTVVPADRLTRYVDKLGVGRVTDVAILGRGKGGRITGLRILGTEGKADVLRELPVRRLFGNLNSGAFVLTVDKDDAGFVERLTFEGGGWGHGVGMCQMGAIGRAEAGQTFKEILSHYYGGAVVERIY